MINEKFKIFARAEDLPPLWDDLTENFFQKRSFLSFLEEANPCDQRYHLNEAEGIVLVTYRLWLDILTFSEKFCIKIPIKIAGIPLSVASAGYCCPRASLATLSAYLQTFGLILILNTDGGLFLPKGLTLPTFELSVDTPEGHLSRMRSHYRYRIRKAIRRGKGLRFEKMENEDLDLKMYRYYEEVYERSEGKLEKLRIDFFRRCPAQLYRIKDEQDVSVGFFQIKESSDELIFLFCGFDHTKNKAYDLYLNILIKLIELGQGKKIFLGQTTSYSKSRVGATPKALYFHLASRYLPDRWLEKIAKSLEHRWSYRIRCMKDPELSSSEKE